MFPSIPHFYREANLGYLRKSTWIYENCWPCRHYIIVAAHVPHGAVVFLFTPSATKISEQEHRTPSVLVQYDLKRPCAVKPQSINQSFSVVSWYPHKPVAVGWTRGDTLRRRRNSVNVLIAPQLHMFQRWTEWIWRFEVPAEAERNEFAGYTGTRCLGAESPDWDPADNCGILNMVRNSASKRTLIFSSCFSSRGTVLDHSSHGTIRTLMVSINAQLLSIPHDWEFRLIRTYFAAREPSNNQYSVFSRPQRISECALLWRLSLPRSFDIACAAK